jgi:hypothetical protein
MRIWRRRRTWRRWWRRTAARLSAVKLAGDPNNPARFKDDASVDELREEIMRQLGHLVSAGVIDLKALPVPDGQQKSNHSR